MREILFIGKDSDGIWHEGFYCVLNSKSHRIYTGYAETDCGTYYPDFHTVIPETVCQYTGLTDKNGTKIFEGDILKYTRKKWHEPLSNKNNQDMVCFCEVYFDEKTHCFRFYHYEEDTKRCIGSGLLTFDDSRAEENIIEVIGNIFDNPELLKGGERE